MKKIISLSAVLIFSAVCTSTTFAACFPEGCFNTSNGAVNSQTFNDTYNWLTSTVPQSLLGTTPSTFTGTITYTHPVWHHGTSATFVNGQLTALTCYNGFSATFTHKPQCPANQFMSNGSCVVCQNGGCTNGQCNNGANNPPSCSVCPTDKVMQNNSCVVCQNGGCTNGQCNNGANNPPSCNQCSFGRQFINNSCGPCSNGGTVESQCNSCPTGSSFFNGSCAPTCDVTNVCGITTQSHLVNGTCQTPPDINATCIQNFSVTTGTINPNGSVEFTWKLAKVPGIGSRCGFVDLTTATPRPIPGLQNLDPNLDRIRISNVQTTTRFCLVCQFYKLLDNSILGDAAVHQWVRVLRIGEQ